MMTTMAALLGGLPLALGTGTGAELRRPLGHQHRRRPADQPAPDAVHHAGRLPVVRPSRSPFLPRSDRAIPSSRNRRRTEGANVRMNISAPFINRPIATSLLTADPATGGCHRLQFSSRSAPLPEVDFPTISVQAQLPGASPETMASSRGDAARAAIWTDRGRDRDDVEQPGSDRRNVTLQFDLNRNIDAAARDVQAAINASAGQLARESSQPADLPQKSIRPIADHDSGGAVRCSAPEPAV